MYACYARSRHTNSDVQKEKHFSENIAWPSNAGTRETWSNVVDTRTLFPPVGKCRRAAQANVLLAGRIQFIIEQRRYSVPPVVVAPADRRAHPCRRSILYRCNVIQSLFSDEVVKRRRANDTLYM